MDELLGIGSLPDIGAQDSLFAMPTAPRSIGGDVANPVATVHVDMHQPHMDRTFDYLVPAKFDALVTPGVRVQVPVGTQKVSGCVITRGTITDTAGALRPIDRVISPLPVLDPEVYAVAQRVARRSAGSVSDILRLAIPPRHARAEREYLSEYGPIEYSSAPVSEVREEVAGDSPYSPQSSEASRAMASWQPYVGGPAFVMRLQNGESPRAVCHELPGASRDDGPLIGACLATRESGRGVIIILPTARRVAEVAEPLRELFGNQVAVLLGDEPPEKRYHTFLRILGGQATIVIGTRAAAWAPVHHLGLVALYDDAAPTLREQRSPYVEARDVLALRASTAHAGMLISAPYVSVQSAALINSGWAALLEATPGTHHAYVARVSSPEQWIHEEASWQRLPDAAFAMVRDALTRGPVLVVVPRAGYIPSVACSSCSRQALCPQCGGTLAQSMPEAPATCTRCGANPTWRCPHCHGRSLRATRIGSHRTAEEIGKAFPGVGVILSGAGSPDGIAHQVRDVPRIIVATPGAEPQAESGYAGALVLDSRYLRGDGLEADISFMRHATRVISLVRSASDGGHVMFAGGIDPASLQALSQWDLAPYARSLLAEREGLQLPPTARWLAITGERANIRRLLGLIRAYANERSSSPLRHPTEDILFVTGVHEFVGGISVLGPVEAKGHEVTVYLRSALAFAMELADIARDAYRTYSGQNLGEPLRLEIDPRM